MDMKNIQNIGHLLFGDDEVKQTFASLSENEKKEFEVDLAYILQKTNQQMKQDNLFEGHVLANQRLGNRNFRVELWLDLQSEESPLIIFQQFKELEIDDYLDNINSDKQLENEGFIEL